jgi:hypothetical protein
MRRSAKRSIAALEIMSQLYIGDYFGDTLHFSSSEHAIFRLQLLHVWLTETPARSKWARVAGLGRWEWREIRPIIWPLLEIAIANIGDWKMAIRAYDGMRLPPAEWHIVRSIVLERDGYVCTYCSNPTRLHVDHVIPLARGGSNAFDNLVTSCGPCNQSKGPKLPEEWKSTIKKRETSRATIEKARRQKQP